MAKDEPKQVLIWRNDLRNEQGHKCRTGKICAQLAHASMKAILDLGNFENTKTSCDFSIPDIDKHEALVDWLEGRFIKVCVSVDSKEELLNIYETAKDAGLICSLIVDAGLTEFGGIPTHTCCAVGPAYPEDIDQITGHLKLL